MPVKFEGSGPYHLPVAHSATAERNEGNGVTLIIECLVAEDLEALNVQMTADLAMELGAKLLAAAADRVD